MGLVWILGTLLFLVTVGVLTVGSLLGAATLEWRYRVSYGDWNRAGRETIMIVNHHWYSKTKQTRRSARSRQAEICASGRNQKTKTTLKQRVELPQINILPKCPQLPKPLSDYVDTSEKDDSNTGTELP